MKCVILAAGEGKRMHPLTFTRPKVMLPIANKPILEWNLNNAKKAGLKEFIFVVGYKSEMVRSYFGNGEKWGVKINYVNQGKALGTAHAVGMVEKFVDDFIVLCGDTIFGKDDIKNILDKGISMGLLKVDNPEEYGIVEIKGKKVLKIYEKVNNPISNVINGGIYHFDKKIFNYIKKTEKSSRGEYEITDSINMMVNEIEVVGAQFQSSLPAAQIHRFLERDQLVFTLRDQTGKVVGACRFTPSFPGCFPFEIHGTEGFDDFIKGLRVNALPEFDYVRVTFTDNPKLGQLCERRGYRLHHKLHKMQLKL